MRILIFIAFVSVFSFAKQYGVYDLNGNLVSTFETESHGLSEKIQQIKNDNLQKRLYISSILKDSDFKQGYRYLYKAEMGAYIEASRKETFSVCPDKEIIGTWISEHSVALNADNCISIKTPNLAGTINILFLKNNSLIDTIRVLVEQSYIPMGNYSHKVWISDIPSAICDPNYGNTICEAEAYGHYENKKYEQALIVDKTEFTMGDAWYYSELGIKLDRWLVGNMPNELVYASNSPDGRYVTPFATKIYPLKEDLKKSMRPYIEGSNTEWRFANMRSKLEGLDTVYRFVLDEKGQSKFMVDTSVLGYRLPYKDEWGMLMRAGASTRYYWGDEEDSLTISRYTLVRPIGYIQHIVAQKQPNAFGLYDMISPNNTNIVFGKVCVHGRYDQMHECRFLADKVARRVESGTIMMCPIGISGVSEVEKCEKIFISDFNATSIRLLRKTPKLHKLERL